MTSLPVDKTIASIRDRLTRIGESLKGRGELLITSHNNPDPDAIASSVLLHVLLSRMFDLPTTIGFGGVIGRAENTALIKYAGVKFTPFHEIETGRFDGVALVDTQPGTGNNPVEAVENVVMVFDHHRLRPQTRSVPFYDVRRSIGATTTLLYLYWKAAGIKPTRRQTTMMFYGLRSETADMGREASAIDRELYKELYAAADLRALAAIVNAKVGRDYFSTIHEAMERSLVYDNLIVTALGRVPYPDAVAQIAEYFLKYRGASYAFSVGRYRGQILLSIRSDDPTVQLGEVAKRIVHGLGTAGGHDSSAGGQIIVEGKKAGDIEKIEKTIVRRLLRALKIGGRKPRRLLKVPV